MTKTTTVKFDFNKIKEGYGVDVKSEVEGQWFELTAIDGVKVKVARINNPQYRKKMRQLYDKYAHKLKRNRLSVELDDKIQMELLVTTILKDWSGMPGIDGKDVSYSIEAARQLFATPGLNELKDEILNFANEFEAFQTEIDDDLKKN